MTPNITCASEDIRPGMLPDTEKNQRAEPFPRTETPLVIFTCSATPHIS